MTFEQFCAKFQGRFLLHLCEAWAARKADSSSQGMLIDKHANDTKALMREIYDQLSPPPPKPQANGNGHAVVAARKVEK